MATPTFSYEPTFQYGHEETPYRLLTKEHVSTIDLGGGRSMLKVEGEALRLLARQAFEDVSFYLRPAHRRQLAE
jgi:fumarate hydratase class I